MNDRFAAAQTESARRHQAADKKEFKDGLYIDYPLLPFTGEGRSVLRDSMMPDLVYDGGNLDTFADVWRKCYYDDENFTAIFCGGNYSTDLNTYGNEILGTEESFVIYVD